MHGVLTPQGVRALLERSYAASYQRANIRMTEAEIQRQVLADLELVDAATRAGEIRGGSGPPVDLSQVREKPDVIAQAEAETNTRLQIERDETKQGRHAYRPAALHMNPQRLGERWGYAVARINRIIEGAGGASTITGSAANAAIPSLALKYNETWSFYLTRSRPPPSTGVDHNPFRGLSDRDASRKFIRAIEDICDQSSKWLGSWYVK